MPKTVITYEAAYAKRYFVVILDLEWVMIKTAENYSMPF
jgi:hypothetical protein